MDGLLLPLLVAASVATFAWAAVAAATGSGRGQRRRLQQRLSVEGRQDGGGGGGAGGTAGRSIVVQLKVTGVPEFLAARPFIQALNRRLLQAYPDRSLGRFLAVAATYAIVFGGITLLVTATPVVGLAAGAAGGYLPFMLLNMKANKRQRLIALQLPEALDFLTRILKAGHSLSTGLQMMGEELPQPLCGEFRKAYDQHSLGVSMRTRSARPPPASRAATSPSSSPRCSSSGRPAATCPRCSRTSAA
jgi:tight adherence protein B